MFLFHAMSSFLSAEFSISTLREIRNRRFAARVSFLPQRSGRFKGFFFLFFTETEEHHEYRVDSGQVYTQLLYGKNKPVDSLLTVTPQNKVQHSSSHSSVHVSTQRFTHRGEKKKRFS